MKSIISRAKKKLSNYIADRPIKSQFRKYGAGYVVDIASHTTRHELRMLYYLAKLMPENSCCLEIGSYLGASTCYIAMGLAERGGDLYCVDTWSNETMPEGIKDTYSEFLKNVLPFSSSIQIIRKRSDELSYKDLPSQINFAFVDGDHSYEVANKDYKFISEIISPKGIIAFHDFLHFRGVSRTVGEALASGAWSLAGVSGNLCWIRKQEFVK